MSPTVITALLVEVSPMAALGTPIKYRSIDYLRICIDIYIYVYNMNFNF